MEALNEIVDGISESAAGVPGAQVRYGTAMSQLALHGSPAVVEAFRRFQDRGETVAQEGRDLLVGALLAARSELDHGEISADDAWVLLFDSPTQWLDPSRPPSAEDGAKRRPQVRAAKPPLM